MTVVEVIATADKPIAAKTPAKPASKAIAKAAPKVKKTAVPAKPKTKPVAKVAAKAVAKPVTKPIAKVATAQPVKLKKPKMVRDSFTFPKAEYAVLDGLKMRAAKLGSPIKKTELLRAGIKAIAAMQDAAFVAALKSVPSLKTGRPAKN